MIVYSGGSFDVLHAGHVELLAACAGMAGPHGRVVVSLNTDAFIAEYKGRAPVCTYGQREAMLRAIRYVDEVIPNVGGWDSRPAIESVRPHILAVGDDWAGRDYHAQMGFTPAWLDERGIELVFVPRTTGLSSTLIKARMVER
jgi:glycerol-3-phosphate cytidylyltransferase